MKRILVLSLMVMLIISGCTFKENKDIVSTPISDNIQNGEGVIAPMSAEELIQKLSKLNENMKMSDVINVFGKEPRMVIETNSNIWEYFSGDITISLVGIGVTDTPLYQVLLSHGDSNIEIKLKTIEES